MTSKCFSACFNWGTHKGLHLNPSKLFKLPETIGEISSVSIGPYHSAVINKSGELFTYGFNRFDHLTHPTTFTPTKVTLPPISQVQCGENFTIALTTKGEIYAWGSTLKNSWFFEKFFESRHALPLPIPKLNNFLPPTHIEMPEEITDIACGKLHCLALGKYNVYSWGINDYGQLGHPSLFDSYNKPTPINFFQNIGFNIAKIYAGGYSSGIISTTGKAYVWGNNSYGQLGIDRMGWFEYLPVSIPLNEIYNIKDLYIGEKSSMVITENDEIFSSGLIYWQKFEKFDLPANKKPLQLCCGDDFFAVLTTDSSIVFYGGPFSLNPEDEELPKKIQITEDSFIPGEIKRLEGKYGFMAAISDVDLDELKS